MKANKVIADKVIEDFERAEKTLEGKIKESNSVIDQISAYAYFKGQCQSIIKQLTLIK